METWLVFQKHKQESHLLRQECGALRVSCIGERKLVLKSLESLECKYLH